eukprot:GHRR01019695.1.p1 GENE.GHRR01019695.1~~GHRR01019695.1.p1  ORF type:complete len:459 (+),score=206.60 GHRR01019695.1:248-1624(+)
MDGQTRRESRIPKLPPAAGAKPLAEKSNILDRKRRGAPLEGIPEAKRLVRAASGAASTSRITATAAGSETPAAAKPDETWEDIADRTGMTADDVLNRKLTFKKGTLPAKKLEEMGPVIKELKALGWHLLSSKGRAEMDAAQWEADATEKQQKIAELEQAFSDAQAKLQQQMNDLQAEVQQAESQVQQLQKQLTAAEGSLSSKTNELQGLQKQLERVQQELARAAAAVTEREFKVHEMEDVVRQSQSYASTLQNYNTSLQADVQLGKSRCDELSKEKDKLQGQVAELGGMLKSQERVLELEKDQCRKLRDDRETAMKDLAVLRCDLEAGRQERERLMEELKGVKEELQKYKDAGGKSMETLEAVKHSKATLEAQLNSQRSLIDSMRQELGTAREQHALADSLANSREAQLKELQAQLMSLQGSLTEAERRVYESELIRRKLHNTIQVSKHQATAVTTLM